MRKDVKLKDGTIVSNLGMGTWYLGENRSVENQEIEAIRAGIDAGITLIDTAEMYGMGKAEQLVGKAIKGYDREKLFLVSKVFPQNAGRHKIFQACENSLKRMQTDYMDLYLLHWRGSVPFSETVECMEKLVQQGKIKRWGVSNLDLDEMEELNEVKNGTHCMVDQVLYHVGSKGIEYDLYPWLKEQGIATMAYCPMAQAGSLQRQLLNNRVLNEVAGNHGISVQNLMLAYVLTKDQMIAIPRTGKKSHMLENVGMWDVQLSEEEIKQIDTAYPKPARQQYLDIV